MKPLVVHFFGNAGECRTEAEISVSTGDGVSRDIAIVYETVDGWHVETLSPGLADQFSGELPAAVERAKSGLQRYVNRLGINPPEGLSVTGLSAWLMEKDDGTIMGKPVA